MKAIKWIVKLLILITVTPFGFALSFMPGYQGGFEWFEYCGMVLFNLPDGWIRGKSTVCYIGLMRG